ncbi:hypothetical protein Rhe02_88040 [Rhizocola hellebori]|uniref:LppX_LprAFG lipoprotein n=1 Tax=Rhizocola hellebori TaxID=1392758 RepID=A0A8J3VLJ7_9ACTN|nr:hypothetical protein [Rhizocola hellebori]GIH10737.1 hypothetical protein Rhe02_88040 [Rhizocola hellebori]
MRFARLLVPIALTSVVLAGCVNTKDPSGGAAPTTVADNGVKDLPVAEIVAKAAAATDAAGSYRVKGEVTQDGRKLSVDAQIKSKDVSGTVTMTQGAAKVRRVGTSLYLQADPALWGIFAGPAAETIATLFKGKWVKTSTATKEFAELATIGDVTQMVQTYGTSTITKGELKTVNGMRVIELKEASGGSIFVATTGEPYIVRVELKDGALDVSEFGAKFDDIVAPPADQVVDLSGLMGMGK